ncbi:MAG: hypothetical protein A3K09_01875 [Nitrospinae bacterium RIFCSPLOWO2_12_FULL_47_7]|nr:MAG: hypothetical protein A3K09_01875 [Nitrospinae bacterium RIFCSPLOWO2_12_FULL_47_7]
MSSPISLHPFLSHFPPALFLAGLVLLALAKKRNHSGFAAAASLDFSLGFLAAVIAAFSGMLSVDMGTKTALQVESHQGYSFIFTVLYGFCTVFSYTKTYSGAALVFYILNLIAMCASVYSGYLLVFHSMG